MLHPQRSLLPSQFAPGCGSSKATTGPTCSCKSSHGTNKRPDRRSSATNQVQGQEENSTIGEVRGGSRGRKGRCNGNRLPAEVGDPLRGRRSRTGHGTHNPIVRGQVMVEIVKPSALKFCKGLVFSPAGNGKTTFLGTAQEDPRTAPMLLLDFEGGTESLDGLDIDVAPIHSWEDYDEVFEMLLSEEHGYRSLGVDSVSETHIFALLAILDKEGPSRKDPELLE